MILPRFEYHQPTTIDDALKAARALSDRQQPFDYVAGGTDLLPNYKQRLNNRAHVISLSHIAELRAISPSRIGALATLQEIERSPDLQSIPVLAKAASQIASPLLRAAGTLGGNLLLETRCYYFNQSEFWREAKGGCLKEGGKVCLVVPNETVCYATYSGDLAPVLMTLGASIELRGFTGSRFLPLADFFSPDGIAKNVRSREEILLAVHLPDDARRAQASYEKLRVRDTIDFPLLGLAAALWRTPSGDIEKLRVAATATDTVPLLFEDLTASAIGNRLTPLLIDRISAGVKKRVQPVKNVSLRPLYRKKMAEVLTRRLLTSLG